jgi:AcrR family transcriptional regulator
MTTISDAAVVADPVTSASEAVQARKPKRADARRNYEALIEAAREAFAEGGTATSLEDIARRAGVGIGTLYRHFPTRQDLFEAVYVTEVDALCRSVADFADLGPWDAFAAWIDRFAAYAATKKAVAEQLIADGGRDNPIFRTCRSAIFAAGEPLLARAQADGSARPDTSFDDVIRLLGGVTMLDVPREQMQRVLGIAVDGLRARN